MVEGVANREGGRGKAYHGWHPTPPQASLGSNNELRAMQLPNNGVAVIGHLVAQTRFKWDQTLGCAISWTNENNG